MIELLVHSFESSLGEIRNWPLYLEDKERPKKEADCSRLVGVRLNKQGNLFFRLFRGGHKTSRSLHPPDGILKVYIEALKGSVTDTIQMVSSTHFSFKAVSVGGTYIPRTWEGV